MLKRTDDRKETRIPARIVTGDRDVDCLVCDVSMGGARLRVADPNAIPQEFELVFQRTGELRRAKVRWRRAKDVGISFLKERRIFGRRVTPPRLTG